MASSPIALTPQEKAEFRQIFDRRLASVRPETAEAFTFREDAPVPFIATAPSTICSAKT